MATWTQAEIDAQKAKVLGAKSVTYSDKSVTHYDLQEQLALLAQMEADNASAGAATSTGRSTLAAFARE